MPPDGAGSTLDALLKQKAAARVAAAARARRPPPPAPGLSEQEKEAIVAQEVGRAAGGDWGPVFVYGSMLSQESWIALIGRVPEMKTAVLRGFARRGLCCAGFAALVEQAGSLVVGQAVVGLMPKERRLFDSVVDDGFSLAQVVARQLDESDMEPMDCSTYVWREEFRDALVEEDWDFERFQEEYLADFVAVCKDAREEHRVERLPDEELKTLALARRRSQTGLDDEGASHWDRD